MTYDEWLKKKEEQARSGSNSQKSKPAGYDEWKASKAGPSSTAKPAGYEAWEASKAEPSSVPQQASFPGFDSKLKRKPSGPSRSSYDAMRTFDIEAGAREIAQLESILREYQSLSRWMTDETGEARAAAIRQQYGGEDEIQALIQQKRQYLNQSRRLQDGIAMSAVVDNPDFKEMSGYVSTENNEGALQKALSYGSGLGLGYDDLTYEYINNQNGIRDEVKQRFRVYTRSGDESPYEKKGYDYLTDDEISIYNYHYNKDGKKAAEAYLDSIQETLSHRKATSMFGNMEDHTALEIAFGLVAGLDQFESGMKSLGQAISGEADYIPASAYQMASGMVREDLGDVGPKLPEWMGGATLGQMGYDTVTTSANMVPSIVTSMALSAINPVAGAVTGSAMMGASAGGMAYQEKLNQGYDKGQAETYATLIGGLEGCLQYLLGGIGSLGGKVSGNVVGKILNGVDNAFARTAIKLGGNMLSEGFEEGLQEILAPWIQNLVLHADEDIDWGEVAYSSLLGALTAGFMEGGSTISGEVNTYQTGRQLQDGGITAQRLADIGSTFSADTVAHQLAGRVNENTGAYTMGRLFNEIGAELTEQNKADIVQNLVNKGVDPDHARIHADVMAYIMDGGQLSDIQMRMIEQNDVLAKTMQEVIIDPNSTVNQRLKGFNEAHAVLTGKTPEVSAPVAEQPAQTEAAAPSGDTVPAAEEVPAEGHYESSADGKTILKSSGETVTIKEIAAIKDGKMTLKLDDGRTVDASDVSYSSQDEALVYEAVADMGTNAVTADLLVKAFESGSISAQDYVHGIKEAYTYGQYNFPMKEVANGPFASMLSDEQRNTAYKLGQIFSGKQVAKEQATVRGKRTVAKNATTDHLRDTTKKVGKVFFDRKGRTFDDVREVSLKTMEQLSAALGVEFYVFESYVNESGHRVYKTENGKEVAAPNGFYDPKDSSIHIDLNAGRDGKGTMLFTVAHELTHFIRQWSPAKFKVLANFLNQQYGEKGKSVSALVDEQIAKAKRNGRTISYAVAYEEVVADSMESMLTDGNVVQMMSDLAQQDKSLWQKICDWFKDLVSDLKAIVDAYTGKSPDSIEGKLVADMQDVIIILESLYADALVDASENRWAAPKAEKNTTQEGGAKFQTRNVNGDQVVWIEANILKENKGLPVHQYVANYIAEHIGEVYTIIESGQKVYIGQDLPGEYTQSKYTKAILRNNPNIARAKNRASANLGEMIEIATNRRWEKTKHHGSKDAKYGMYRYDTRFGFPVKDTSGRVTGANIFRAELLIRNASDGKKYLYDIVSIKKDTASSDWLTQRVTSAAGKTAGQKGVVFKDNVAQKTTEVNKKFSSRDSNGNPLTAEQQVYFKDSKVRDEQGRLLVVYHGTPSGKHTTFRSGTYFTPDRQYADVYQSPGASALSVKREKGAPKTYEVYLNITKPFDTRNPAERKIFMQEYYRQWGTGAPLADSGLPDWTDGMDLQEFIEEMGYDYDGLILDEGATGGYGLEVKSRGLSYVTFSSNQVKNVDNVTPTSDPDIRYSDRDYLDAVNRGDMRAAQRMVDEAAERWGAYRNNDEANEVFHQDGRIRTFYHGTNTGDFTTFDRGLLGSSSGDLGWFGKGFYFAFSYDEAATYGGRVIPAYLRMRKPFDYSQLYKFKGSDKGSSRYSRFAWVYNITKQFPDLAEGQRVWAYPNDAEEGTAVSWKQLAGWMDRVHKEKQFSVEEVEQSDGTTAWELRADPKKESFTTDDGETFEWIEYGMRKLFATEQDAREPLNQVCAYLENMMGVESVPRRAIERIDFSGAVQRAGYDGILQSMSGDEAVVFSPEQIKTSEPVTYDDNGNVIPLSKRFDSGNPDIRYSERVTDQKILDFLDSQKTITTYKTMQLVDGKLYPPMAARTNGAYEDYSVLGTWEQATEHPELIKNGNKYKLDKGKGQGSIEAAYNPYMHSSNLVLNDQFSGAYARDNLVTIECEVPVSEITSGYHAQHAKDSVGWHAWHTGTVAGAIRKAKGVERQVFLSRWIKPVRIVPDSEVAAMYKDLLDGTDIAVPDNVVTPSLLLELKKAGVKIKESGRVKYSDRDPEQQRVNRVLEKENAKLREDVTYLKELLRLQRIVTGGKKFTKTSVEAAATKLMKDAGARGTKAELVGLLNGFYEYVAAGEELTWEGVVEQAQPVVQWLQANEHAKKQTNEYAADILRELRGTRISLDDLQKKEVAYQYGSFNEFRKKAMGSIIVTNTGTPLDVQWIELSRLYPNIFNPETTSNDMPAALLDAISTLRNMHPESEFGYDREMAAQDLLHQVYDSYWSVSTLYTVADVKQREINRLKSAHHQRMTDLREAHRENTAKLKQQHSADLKRVREEMRAAADAKQQKTIQKYQESRQRGIESRNKTAMRHKIQRVVTDLNQYLLNGTKDRHVPIGLQKAVAEALDAVNMDTVGADERLAKLQAEMVRAKTPQQVAEIAKKFDHVREMDDRMQARLKALHDAYEEIKNDEDPLMSNVYDDGLSAHMMTLIVEVGDTPLRDMTMHQLECVYDVYQIVLTAVRNANKAFKTAKNESIAALGNMAMLEVSGIGGKKQYGMKGMEGIKSFGWNNLKPVYAFEHIGSKTLIELFNNVRAGEDVWAVDVTEAREYYLDKAKRYKYNSWDFAKRHTFKSTSGMDFSLNLEQIMSLYAYSKRDQAADHLRRGGIVIDETTEVTMRTKLGIPVKFNPTEATAYNISDMTLAEIVGTLTSEQKGFVDEMQDYLSTVMGGKGNEVSLTMYGIKLFKEKFYFPLKSAPQFMAKAKEQQQGEVKIKNSGFSKQTVKKASNPIVLTPFMNVWADHVNEMSMYHAFVLPMEDFYRVYNFKTPTSEGTATQSVEMTIQNAYGKGATKYIDQLLKDLNGGARTDSTTGIINKMTGLFKKGAVFASLSVVVQQPSAIARAAALIDTKYFIGPKVDQKKHKALWEEVKRYAPVAIIKEMGYFDTNMGKSTQDFIMGKEYSGFSEKMKAVVADSNYRDEILSKAPALADELAWCSIWEAVKRETVAKNTGMAAYSDEFLQKAGQRFTEVITKTQVYDSVLSRSALMRSKDTGMKMATAFMAEPTTSINMIADALLKGKRGNRKYARGAIGAVIASQILNSILVSFVYAGRDDDEDETYLEKYLGTLTGELLDSLNPATYIPFIKDIISIVQGYDVERSDMAVVSDLWNAWQKLSSDKLSPYRKVEGFVGSVAQLFGLPVKNVMRDARGIYQTIASFMSGQKTTKAGIGYAVQSAVTGQTVSNQQQLYEAYLSGDKSQISRVEGRFKNQSAINTAIRAALRENDSRIRVAAEARVNGNLTEYTRLAKEIIAEGHFSQDNVIAAINAEINAMSKNDSTSTPKALGLYKAEDFATAISGGDSAMASAVRDDIIQTAQKNGKTADEAEKSFVSSAKTAMKELFLSSGITETQAVNALVAYCGETGEEARKRVAEWAFEAEFGFAYGEKVQKFKDGEISAAELKGVLIDVDGKTDDEAASAIYDYARDGYAEGYFSRTEAAELMVQYGGLTRTEAEAKLRYIDFKAENPYVNVDYSWVDEYYDEVQPSGISIDLFVEYRNTVKSMTGTNKKVQRMAVIDSLPISNDQKDALYYAEGWVSSRLYEAPWH